MTMWMLLLAGCGKDRPCLYCDQALAHMAEKIALNDCNPAFMEDAVQGIIDDCGEVKDDDDDLIVDDIYGLIGSLHEQCQAERLPKESCEGPRPRFQIEHLVTADVLALYPEGITFVARIGNYEQTFDVTEPDQPTLLERAASAPEGAQVIIDVYSLGTDPGVDPAIAGAIETFVVRRDDNVWSLPRRRATLSVTADQQLTLSLSDF